jgi:hypothetical protein
MINAVRRSGDSTCVFLPMPRLVSTRQLPTACWMAFSTSGRVSNAWRSTPLALRTSPRQISPSTKQLLRFGTHSTDPVYDLRPRPSKMISPPPATTRTHKGENRETGWWILDAVRACMRCEHHRHVSAPSTAPAATQALAVCGSWGDAPGLDAQGGRAARRHRQAADGGDAQRCSGLGDGHGAACGTHGRATRHARGRHARAHGHHPHS